LHRRAGLEHDGVARDDGQDIFNLIDQQAVAYSDSGPRITLRYSASKAGATRCAAST